MELPDLYTEKKVSPKGQVNKDDLKKWGRNLLVFLAPLAVIYLLQLYAVLQNGFLSLTDFIPSQITLGAIELYVVNALLDLFRKFTDSKK